MLITFNLDVPKSLEKEILEDYSTVADWAESVLEEEIDYYKEIYGVEDDDGSTPVD